MGVSETVQILFTAKDQVSGTLSGIRKNTKALSKDSKKNLQAFGNQLDKVGRIAAVGLAAGLAVAAKEAMDFDTQMRNVDTIAKFTTEEFVAMNDQVLEMSKSFPQSAEDMASSLYDVYSSGFEGETAMNVLEIAAKGASAGLTDTKVAGKGLMAVMNAYNQKTGPDAERIMDIMFKTVEKGVLTFEALSGNVGTVIATASAAGVTFEEVAAGFATMTKGGITAAESGTALNQVMLSFIKPGEAMTAKLAEMGYESGSAAIEAKGFSGIVLELAGNTGIAADALSETQKEAILNAEAWEDLTDVQGLNIEELAKLFPNVRALKGILSMTREEGRVYAEQLEAMAEATGATDEAFQRQSEGMKFQYDLLKGELNVVLIKLGSEIMPGLLKATRKLTEVLKKNKWIIYLLTGVLITFVAAWAAVKTAMAIKTTVLGINTIFTILGTSTAGLTTGMWGLAASVWAVAAPGLAFAAVAVAAYLVMKKFDALQDSLNELYTSQRNNEDQIVILNKKINEMDPGPAREKLEKLRDELQGTVDDAKEVEKRYSSLGGYFKDFGKLIVEVLRNMTSDMGNLLASGVELWTNTIGGFIGTIAGYFADLTVSALFWGQDMINGFISGIDDTKEALFEKIIETFSDVITWAKKVLGIASPSKVFEAFGQDIITGLVQGIEDDAELEKALNNSEKRFFDFIDANETLGEKIKAVWTDLGETMEDFDDKVKETVQNFKTDFANTVLNIRESIKSKEQQIAEELIDTEERKVELEKQLNEELVKSAEEKDEAKIASLLAEIAEESSFLEKHRQAYNDYNKEIITERENRSKDAIELLQEEIMNEQAILNAHKEEIKKYNKEIKDAAFLRGLDELEYLKEMKTREVNVIRKQMKLARKAAKTQIKLMKGDVKGLLETIKEEFGKVPNYLKTLFENLDTTIVDKIGKINQELGITSSVAGEISAYADGGVVPGPIGSPQLAVVHGGERISTVGGTDRGGSVTYNINFNNPVVRSDADLNTLADMVTEKLSRLNERIRLSGGI